MDLDTLLRIAKEDPGLTQAQKDELINDSDRDRLDKLLSGVAGGILTLAVTRYLKMSKLAQTLLSLSGFGAGMLIYNYFTERKFANYDDKSKTFKIDTKRY